MIKTLDVTGWQGYVLHGCGKLEIFIHIANKPRMGNEECGRQTMMKRHPHISVG